MVEEGERETEGHTKTRKCYHHREGTDSKNVQLESSSFITCTRILLFCFKKATSLHRLKQHLQECVNAGQVPAWMTEGRTVLITKDKSKGTVVRNYRTTICLKLMWKLLTSIFSEAMYGHFNSQELLPNEQKGCKKTIF